MSQDVNQSSEQSQWQSFLQWQKDSAVSHESWSSFWQAVDKRPAVEVRVTVDDRYTEVGDAIWVNSDLPPSYASSGIDFVALLTVQKQYVHHLQLPLTRSEAISLIEILSDMVRES